MIPLNRENHLELYYLLEELVSLFHDPDRYHNAMTIERFAENYYPLIHHLYYETVWNALSIEERKRILGEDYVDEIDGKDHFISELSANYQRRK